jgi:hypothetical protein
MENERLARLEEKCERIPEIEKKVDRLLEFKWKAIGAAMLAAFIATTLAEMMR